MMKNYYRLFGGCKHKKTQLVYDIIWIETNPPKPKYYKANVCTCCDKKINMTYITKEEFDENKRKSKLERICRTN